MRMLITATVETVNQAAYMQAVREAVRVAFMAAGRRFLMIAVPRIPIWTGMARGAFRNAEDLFGQVSSSGARRPVRIRIGRRGSNKDTPERRGYYYYPPNGGRVERTPNRGREYSTPTNEIIQIQGGTLASGRSAMRMRYHVNLTYFTRLDEERWHAFRDATAAIVQYLNANLRLPDMADFMIRRQITAE